MAAPKMKSPLVDAGRPPDLAVSRPSRRPPEAHRIIVRKNLVDTFEQTTLAVDRDDDHFKYSGRQYLLACFLLRSGIIWTTPRLYRDPSAFDLAIGDAHPPCRFGVHLAPASRILLADRPLTVRELLLFGHVCSRFYQDYPKDLVVHLSLSGAAAAMGYTVSDGGRQLRLTRRAISHLFKVTMVWKEILPDGHERELVFRLLEAYGSDGEHLEHGLVRLTKTAAEMISDTALAYLREDTARELVARNELACRLWMFLESEALHGRDWRYKLFRAPSDEPLPPTNAPIIAELLCLAERMPRKKAAALVRQALAVIEEVDGDRWRCRLVTERAPGMWTLHVERTERPRQLPNSGALALPKPVDKHR